MLKIKMSIKHTKKNYNVNIANMFVLLTNDELNAYFIIMQKKMFYIEFGKKIEAARNAANLTQETLSKRVGLSRTSITNIENGRQRIPFHMVYIFADALGIKAIDLMPEKKLECEKNNHELNLKLEKMKIEENSVKWIKRVIESGKNKEQDNE